MIRYRVSPHVRTLDIGGELFLIGHPFFLTYAVLQAEVWKIFETMLETPRTSAEISERSGVPLEHANEAIEFFLAQHFVIDQNDSEEQAIRSAVGTLREKHTGKNVILDQARQYKDYTPISLRTLAAQLPGGVVKDVRFLIVGGCLTQFSADALEKLAPSFGLRAIVESVWPQYFDADVEANFDVIIFEPHMTAITAPLWDEAPFLSDAERTERLNAIKQNVRISLERIMKGRNRALLLVHGFSTPTYSPFGRVDFRIERSFGAWVRELNDVIISQISGDSNALLIDEEQLLSAEGKAHLMDDAVTIFSHHGPIAAYAGSIPEGSSREEAFDLKESHAAARLFALAHLESFVMWSGIGRIKCIIVDLDNTLWLGVAGEAGFDLRDKNDSYLRYDTFAGIHQALRIVKNRGVLLAVCSRNNETDSEAAWEALEARAVERGLPHLLKREDFVVHRVNWNPKSENVAEILSALGVPAESALFIDDSRVEREEVRAAFPTIRTLGENLHFVRWRLLNDPCLQVNTCTNEGASRTELTKAQLRRDACRASTVDTRGFLLNLGIALTVTRLSARKRLPRVEELVLRTNQFNTNLRRLNEVELWKLVCGSDSNVFVLEASDKFSAYGLVGVCIFENDRITDFILSCRVIPLSAHIPFLVTAVTAYSCFPIRGVIVEGPRNFPCRRLYIEAGFEASQAGEYVLDASSKLPSIDGGIYAISFEQEVA